MKVHGRSSWAFERHSLRISEVVQLRRVDFSTLHHWHWTEWCIATPYDLLFGTHTKKHVLSGREPRKNVTLLYQRIFEGVAELVKLRRSHIDVQRIV